MSLTALRSLHGPAVVFLQANVDTDTIIRVERMAASDHSQLGQYAFETIRYNSDGMKNPDSPFDQPELAGAPFLVAGPNFGCGSSREAAVWALQGLGVRCIIAPGFGDIFRGNCFQNGVLPIELPASAVDSIAERCANGQKLSVDLEASLLQLPDGERMAFAVDPVRREALLQGLDDIGLTMRELPAINAWQARMRLQRPWIWPRPHHAELDASAL